MNLDDKWKGCWAAVRQSMAEGRIDQAEALLYSTLEIAEHFEPDDQRLIMTLECLAEVIFRQQRFPQAEPICKRVIMIYERKFGPEHPDVGVFTNNLGLIYHHQKKFFMAETEYQKALAMQTKLLGQSHPHTLNVMANYARLLKETHRQAEARHMDALMKGANSSANWTQSGTYRAYVVAENEQLTPDGARPPAEALMKAPLPVAQGKRGRAYYSQNEDITLQDVALPPSLNKAETLSVQVNAVPQPSKQTANGMQRLIQQRRQVCD
ncbi:MAG: tetratricopeptide repeat protein [Cyanobacteria bacterium SZAS LIN-2]|nr:tetratricopeptide repeat protein [Cyanobacteria bacterium SZAS LIN-2]